MSHSVCIKSFQAVLLATAVLATSNASADIVISGTRIIYPQSSKDVVVNLDNHGTKPLLVQTWLDDGRDGVNPEELKLPFIITLQYPVLTRKKANPYVLPTQVHLYHRIVNRFSGSMSWRFHQNQKLRIKRILTSFSWHSEHVLNSFTVLTG